MRFVLAVKHLPWTPFQAQIKAWQKLLIDFVDLPMQIVYGNMVRNDYSLRVANSYIHTSEKRGRGALPGRALARA